MRNPLRVYVSVLFILYFVALLVITVLVAPLVLDLSRPYLAAIPLAIVGSLAVFATIAHLAMRHEIEALQTFGISLRATAGPVAVLLFALEGLFAIAVVLLTGDLVYALSCVVTAMASLALAFAVAWGLAWKHGDAGALKACAAAFAAQALFIVVTLSMGTVIGLSASAAAMLVTLVAVLYFSPRSRTFMRCFRS
jgi:hypothetical protein